jgi:hypothetical protein
MDMTDADLTGRWVGHYAQGGREFPITADLRQAGDRLSGTMRDGHPVHEYSLAEAADLAGLPAGGEEEFEERLREAAPGLPPGRVRCVTRLPTGSVLDGRRSGATVEFVKTYRGDTVHEYRVGGQAVGTVSPGHAVRYQGQLDRDEAVIEGQWVIDPDPDTGNVRLSDAFVLRRAGAAGAARPWWRFWG